ncbi:MAG: hypothetical protein AAF389_04730 [Gemmatimonadota bacterium]
MSVDHTIRRTVARARDGGAADEARVAVGTHVAESTAPRAPQFS